MPSAGHRRRQHPFTRSGYPVEPSTGPTLGKSYLWFFPPRLQEPSGFESSQRLIERPIGCELVGLSDCLHVAGNREAVEFTATSLSQVQSGVENRLFDGEDGAWFTLHNVIIGRYLPLSQPSSSRGRLPTTKPYPMQTPGTPGETPDKAGPSPIRPGRDRRHRGWPPASQARRHPRHRAIGCGSYR